VTDSWPVPAPASSWAVAALSFEGEAPYSNQYFVSRPDGLTVPPSVAVVDPTDVTAPVEAEAVVPLVLKSCSPPYVVPAEFDATTRTK